MVSARLASIQESTTLKISAMAKKLTASGLDIIDMGVGEPDFDTPKHTRARRDATPIRMVDPIMRKTPGYSRDAPSDY